MTPDEIKDAIAAGEIGAITLDTSIFDGNGLRLESGLLQRMEQFRGSGIQFVLSEIVAKEVVAHLIKGASEARNQFESACKSLEKNWLTSKDVLVATELAVFQGKSVEKRALERFDSFVGAMDCKLVDASEQVDVKELLHRYFCSESPFSQKENKKNEFPDAFALLSLESWAQETGKKLLVVSKDGDWSRFCKTSGRLVLVEDLASALSMFHRDANVACNVLALRLQNGTFPALIGAIDDAIYRHLDRMDFIVEASSDYVLDDEITDFNIEEIVIGDGEGELPEIEPIDAGSDYLVAKIPVSVEISVRCDFHFSVRDGVDKDYVSIGSASMSTSRTLSFDVLVTFGEPISEITSIDDIEVTGKGRLYLDFGYVQPEWNEDPDGY